MAESPWMRKKIVSTLFSKVMGEEKMEETTRIKEILRNEAQKKVWASIHRELNQTWNPSPTRVGVPMSNGTVKKCSTKEEVEYVIGEEILERFS